MTALTDKILIIGCGCFGVSTAYHLLKRGYRNITLLDRSPELPAPDAASNDINRSMSNHVLSVNPVTHASTLFSNFGVACSTVVRSSYPDKFYCELTREAISLWKNKAEYGDAYHESGVVILGSSNEDSYYAYGSYTNDVASGANVQLLESTEAIRAAFPEGIHIPSFEDKFAYLNKDGGWAFAGKGLKLMLERIVQLGATVLPGKQVKDLVRDGSSGRTTGVDCYDGSKYEADLVIVATGSWTPSAFPDLPLNETCLATGQCVAMIQLTAEEAARYQDCPVVLDYESGFYVFPPNEDSILKVAIHAPGYVNPVNGISTPRTSSSDPQNGAAIPKDGLNELREQLRKVYPDLAEKPFSATRLCWYNDSPDGDWVISKYPGDEGLVFATAGSGHAFKFLPVIGRIVADLIEGKLTAPIVSKFAINRLKTGPDRSRQGQTRKLEIDQLCSAVDLAPTRAS